MIAVKVIVSVCEDGVNLNYFHSNLNQKGQYIDYTEKHTQPNLKSCKIKKMKGSSMIWVEPQAEQNTQDHRNQATRSFVQPDNPHMLLEEFALPPTIVQSDI